MCEHADAIEPLGGPDDLGHLPMDKLWIGPVALESEAGGFHRALVEDQLDLLGMIHVGRGGEDPQRRVSGNEINDALGVRGADKDGLPKVINFGTEAVGHGISKLQDLGEGGVGKAYIG